ncbi:MAG: TIGR03620 family F420-dependent LLM class oxidoreductase [Actinomycetota bacterium]|nr:TIGR03620 family F420-dependent LLM class oxidoreductase [Actinomycetota bacterium]
MASRRTDLGKIGIWTNVLDQVSSATGIEYCQEAQALGYGAVWIPEAVGRDPFVTACRMLSGTESLVLATGIANIYARDAMTMANTLRSIEEAFPARFLLGLGVSHHHLVEWVRKHDYSKPLSFMSSYLKLMGKAKFLAVGPEELPEVVLAALGPKMLQLAATETGGAHPYFVPPEHTAMARQTMGPEAALYPEQMVVLEEDPQVARAIARKHMERYCGLPNYANNLVRLGYDREEVENMSDKIVDAIVAWGSSEIIKTRVDEHFRAGADHVCIQVLADTPDQVVEGWQRLAPYLIS